MCDFQDFILERDNKRVVWEWIGEGWNGDYDKDNPEDVPLLRFSCREYSTRDQAWYGMNDASYCTRMPINSSLDMLARAGVIILEVIVDDVSYKKRLEELSWFCPEDFNK